MKTNIEVVFVIALIIINISIGGFFLYALNAVESPKIVVQVDVTDITLDKMIIETQVEIVNPNFFDLLVQDIEIISTIDAGVEIARFLIEGGNVPANKEKTFTSTDSISFDGEVPNVFTNTIRADVGVQILGFLQKTLPLEMAVVVSVDEILDDLSAPSIEVKAAIEEITEDGIQFHVTIDVSNPNNIEISVGDISVEITTKQDIPIGTLNMTGGTLGPKGSLALDAMGTLLFEALNAETIVFNISGEATAKIAGITQSLSFSADFQLEVPDLAELFLINESMDFTLVGEFKLRIRGIITTISFKVYNPSKIPLEATDLVCSIYGITGESKKLIAQKEMESCTIASKNEVCLTVEINIRYFKLLTSGTGGLFPEWLAITIEGNFSIKGTDQFIPISINGHLDPHLLR